jgi:CheY-like chemotaxis protein
VPFASKAGAGKTCGKYVRNRTHLVNDLAPLWEYGHGGFKAGVACMGSAYPLTGRCILVAEDEPLIAMEMAALLESIGARVVFARTPAVARRAIEVGGLAGAVLDYRLGNENVHEVCALLSARQVPFMFYSGYDDLHERFPQSTVVQKPASGDRLISTIAALVSSASSSGAVLGTVPTN